MQREFMSNLAIWCVLTLAAHAQSSGAGCSMAANRAGYGRTPRTARPAGKHAAAVRD
jgi:hypothetical protein